MSIQLILGKKKKSILRDLFLRIELSKKNLRDQSLRKWAKFAKINLANTLLINTDKVNLLSESENKI